MAMEVEKQDRDGQCRIRVKGEIDLYSSPGLRAAITSAVPGSKNGVVVDLSGVEYMDSSGVATLVEGLRAAMERNISYVLLSPSASVLKVLQLSRLDAVFTIRDAE
jgi:anti-sigma B factor antagonist